jgi:hypothetical protein
MKGLLLFSLALVWCIFAAEAETPARSPQKVTLETKVFTWSFAKQEWSEGQLIKVLVQQFGKDGALASEELFDGKNSLLEKTIYAYEAGVTIKSIFDASGKPIRSSTVTVKGDTETEIVRRMDGSVFQQYVTKRDQAGKILQVSHLDADNKLVFRREYVYDTRGLLAYIRVFNPDGPLAVEIKYEYKAFDESNNWTKREEYYSYGDVHNRPHEIVFRKME